MERDLAASKREVKVEIHRGVALHDKLVACAGSRAVACHRAEMTTGAVRRKGADGRAHGCERGRPKISVIETSQGQFHV